MTATDLTPDNPILLFDGVCNLCNRAVQFVIPRDPEGRIQFAPLQSAPGKALLTRHGLDPGALDSVVLVEDGNVYQKSAAVIRVSELLGWPYRVAGVGRLLPSPVLDRLYDIVAANRYDVFGRKDQCMIPSDDVSDRFLQN
jgi:predicted DCC family thiol-disulfide oxidoreductase YuxK